MKVSKSLITTIVMQIGMLVVYKSMENNYSYKDVKRVLDNNLNAAELKDIHRFLPLYQALTKSAFSYVIIVLFNAYPKVAEIRDNGGYLPLFCNKL